MPTNSYFNNFNDFAEQSLIHSLNVESIQVTGYNMFYLPRREGKMDDVMNEDSMSYFDTAYTLEMYIRNIDGFEGEGSLMDKFGLEVRDRVTLACARKRFTEEIGGIEDISRPKEGSLIYFPMTKKIFEIVYCDNRAIFYPAGTLPVFDITCEVFEYAGEVFDTGIPEIDNITNNFSLDQVARRQTDTNGDPLYNTDGSFLLDAEFDMEEIDPGYDNDDILQQAESATNIVIKNPFRPQ